MEIKKDELITYFNSNNAFTSIDRGRYTEKPHTLTMKDLENPVLCHALHYHQMGLCPIPVLKGHKSPSIPWRQELFHDNVFHRPTFNQMRYWWVKLPGNSHNWENQIALIGGIASRNLVIFDFDGEKKFELKQEMLQKFPELNETLWVRTGAGSPHIWVFADSLPEDCTKLVFTVGDSMIELRANWHISVVPPSIHPVSKTNYDFENNLPIRTVSFEKYLTKFGYAEKKKVDPEKRREKQIHLYGKSRFERMEALNNYIQIELVADRLGLFETLGLEWAGQALQGNCPTGHPSEGEKCFVLSNNLYHCFHCGIGGNAISLVQLINKWDKRRAVRWLTNEFMREEVGNND